MLLLNMVQDTVTQYQGSLGGGAIDKPRKILCTILNHLHTAPQNPNSHTMSITKASVRKGGSSQLKRKRDDPGNNGSSQSAKKAALTPLSRPEQTEYDESIGIMDTNLLADHFAKATRRHYSNSTSIELDDKTLPSKAFRDTASFEEPRLAKHLASFLEKFAEEGKDGLSKCDQVATPHTLIIAPSGIRTADLVRVLRVYNTDESKVAKLFAKHMKLKDNIEYIQKTKVGIGIGTPTRLKDLIEAGAIKVEGLRRIVVDGSYRDEKKRTIFDMGDTFRPTLDLLNMEPIKRKYAHPGDGIDILVF